jgi:predicted nucleotidyltransferase
MSETAVLVPESFLQDAARKIVEAFRPHKIILFGSHAYGKPTRDSDLDFLIVMDTEERRARRIMAVERLFLDREYPMDFVVLTPAELKKRLSGFDPFLREVMRKGKVLYEAATVRA